MKPWTPEERAWAQDCLDLGDTVDEVAEAAGRTPDEVRAAGLKAPHLTPTERQVLPLYAAGCPLVEIDIVRGANVVRPGRAAAACITGLRRKGHAIPHRRPLAVVRACTVARYGDRAEARA